MIKTNNVLETKQISSQFFENWIKLKNIYNNEYTNFNSRSHIWNTVTQILDDIILFFKTNNINLFNNF